MQPTSPQIPVVNTTVTAVASNSRKKVAFIVAGFVILAAGIVSGLFLISRPVDYRTGATQISYQCKLITALNAQGQPLTPTDLTQLKAGDVIRFSVQGNGTSSNYTAVRFTINNVQMAETTTKLGSGDFYQEYTIPQGQTSFSVTAQIKATNGTWY